MNPAPQEQNKFLNLQSPLSSLPGLSPEKCRLLEKNIKRKTIEDLLYYFPRSYLDRTIHKEAHPQVGQETTLMVEVKSVYLSHGRVSRLVAHCQTLQEKGKGRHLDLIWFRGTKYFRNIIKKDMYLIVSGKLDFFRGLQIVHPDFESLDPEEEQDFVHTGRIIPLYSISEALKKRNINSYTLRRIILSALDIIAENIRALSVREKEKNPAPSSNEIKSDTSTESPVPELISPELIAKHKLMDRYKALRSMHFPESKQNKKEALRRLKYEELYLFQFLMYKKSLLRKKKERFFRPLQKDSSKSFKTLCQNLPFHLTEDQEKAIAQIIESCQADYPNAFLLQGDVGSGKTLVALSVSLHYLEAGIQTAFLAPTEILARQHFLTFHELLGLQRAHQLELVTGADKKQERLQKLERIASGEGALVVGTHSLLEESVIFKSLGLVIIDEQQRFGVKQREALDRKGKNPDSIAMSATPIPRSLCLTAFSDLELVSLRQKPAGRKPIQTMYFPSSRRQGVYNSIRRHVSQGKQCYIVYPLIEESEKIDLQAATLAYEKLKSRIFPELRLGLLHGRMKEEEKKKIMQEFHANKIQILVSTSVIEVGVDVPNAAIMLIENAERFGIAQLHQFRGRVGRGTEQGYCVLLSDAKVPESRERLQALVDSEDGFYLAEMDLKIRGTGEILGLRQHGLSELRLTNLLEDRELSEITYKDVRACPKISPEAQGLLSRRFSEGVVIFPN